MSRVPALAPILAVLAAACVSTAPPPVSAVRTAEAGEVGGCRRVGTMRAVPTLYGLFAEQGITEARRAVLEGAAEQGANTVVFDRVEPGATVTG